MTPKLTPKTWLGAEMVVKMMVKMEWTSGRGRKGMSATKQQDAYQHISRLNHSASHVPTQQILYVGVHLERILIGCSGFCNRLILTHNAKLYIALYERI